MTVYLRSASLANYAEVARSVGLDPLRMLARVDLPPACLANADLRVPAAAVMNLLELSAEASGEEAFGLRLAETRKLSTLGLLGMLARDEPTLREAIATLTRHSRLHNESIVARVEESNGTAVLKQEFLPSPAAGRQAVELAVGAMHRILRIILGTDWTARAVSFMHPPPARLDVHRRLFGRSIVFLQDFNGIVLRSADLDTPLALADPELRRYAHQLLASAAPLDQGRARDEVRQLILVLLPSGHCSADQVAMYMGVDRRTVHRRLALEGCTFSSLLAQTREELARHLLQHGHRTLSEVAPLLGFSSLSALSRWRRTHGARDPAR